MAEMLAASGAAPINDCRPVPRGVLPKGLQMWLMVGVAVGMVGIIDVPPGIRSQLRVPRLQPRRHRLDSVRIDCVITKNACAHSTSVRAFSRCPSVAACSGRVAGPG